MNKAACFQISLLLGKITGQPSNIQLEVF